MRAIPARPKKELEVRSDPAGDGAFGAPRGGKPDGHRGTDFLVGVGDEVLSPCVGTITKLGQCYANTPTWRYVQITDRSGLHHRVFYIEPRGHIGKKVNLDTVIGIAMDISNRYPDQGMLPHIHYEIKKGQEYLDPSSFKDKGVTG